MSELNGSKLIAMFPNPKNREFYRFVEDRLVELELTYDELISTMNIHRTRLSRRINNPAEFTLTEIQRFGEVLQIDDVWEELVEAYGCCLDGCSYRELDQLLHIYGDQLGRVKVAA